jgi:dTDP-4-dehydrorhamnose reductase
VSIERSTILIIGASGQLGSEIVRVFADCRTIAPTSATLDITDAAAVDAAVREARPDAIINCAAFNDVDGAEDRPLDALAVNAFAVRSLARAADAAGATLVHYSTDFVFDGATATPYDEAAAPAPQSTYAASKLLGEWFALDAARTFVLRVESLFGTSRDWAGRRGTLDGLVRGIEEHRELRVFTDRVVSPSYTPDVAAATRHLLDAGAPAGLYHCVNGGHATWHDVAAEAARLLGIAPRLTPVTTDEMPLKAGRPRFCALSNRKLAAAGFEMPSWRDALRRWLAARAVAAS